MWLALAAQLEVDEKPAEEYIKQQYPIDMSQIECTDPEWQEWVDDVCVRLPCSRMSMMSWTVGWM